MESVKSVKESLTIRVIDQFSLLFWLFSIFLDFTYHIDGGDKDKKDRNYQKRHQNVHWNKFKVYTLHLPLPYLPSLTILGRSLKSAFW